MGSSVTHSPAFPMTMSLVQAQDLRTITLINFILLKTLQKPKQPQSESAMVEILPHRAGYQLNLAHDDTARFHSTAPPVETPSKAESPTNHIVRSLNITPSSDDTEKRDTCHEELNSRNELRRTANLSNSITGGQTIGCTSRILPVKACEGWVFLAR